MNTPRLRASATLALASLFVAAAGCVGNGGTPGSSAVTHPAVSGTVFTIVFENHDQGAVLSSSVPYFNQLAHTYGSANAYVTSTHPSLPNYILMTSGATQGITDDNAPSSHPLAGTDNLGDQLDTAGVPWRAYMETMGAPCNVNDAGDYAVKHDPFVYYTSMSGDAARCADHVVDFDAHFAADLAADSYRYMWITPNLQNDMHDGTPQQADAWLQRVVPQIMASPGYLNGGAIFILFDEGAVNLNYIVGAPQNLATIVIAPNLVSSGYQSNTAYDHRSYLATVEDILGLPRLATTASVAPMSDFFAAPLATSTGTTTPGATTAP